MERGVVKWFNQVSDYGFVAPDEGGPDRYLRGGNIAGTSAALVAGSHVTFEPREGGMGPEAINVRRLAPIRRRSTGSFEPARRRGAHDPRFPRLERRSGKDAGGPAAAVSDWEGEGGTPG